MSRPGIVSDPSLKPLVVGALGVLAFSVLDAMLKGVSVRMPLFEVLFMRFAWGAVYSTAVFLKARQRLPDRHAIAAQFVRALVSLVAILGFVAALAVLPLANTIVLSYSTPIFMVLFGRLLLGEPITRRAMLAIAVGFAGILVTLSGRLSMMSHEPAVLVGSGGALLSGAAYALSMILVRRRSARVTIEFTILGQNWFAALLALPVAVAAWQPLSWRDGILFATMGVAGVVAQFLTIWAFGRAPASRLAPLEFTSLIWASLFGFVFFAEVPGAATLGGAVLIIASGLIVTYGNPLPLLRPRMARRPQEPAAAATTDRTPAS
jgi:S-adenosylmethionine uptake transporter